MCVYGACDAQGRADAPNSYTGQMMWLVPACLEGFHVILQVRTYRRRRWYICLARSSSVNVSLPLVDVYRVNIMGDMYFALPCHCVRRARDLYGMSCQEGEPFCNTAVVETGLRRFLSYNIACQHDCRVGWSVPVCCIDKVARLQGPVSGVMD